MRRQPQKSTMLKGGVIAQDALRFATILPSATKSTPLFHGIRQQQAGQARPARVKTSIMREHFYVMPTHWRCVTDAGLPDADLSYDVTGNSGCGVGRTRSPSRRAKERASRSEPDPAQARSTDTGQGGLSLARKQSRNAFRITNTLQSLLFRDGKVPTCLKAGVDLIFSSSRGRRAGFCV